MINLSYDLKATTKNNAMILLLLLVIVPIGFAQLNEGDSKILSGENAAIGDFPYLVSIQRMIFNILEVHICGGSVLTLQLVLTAAHCVVDPSKYSTGDGKNPPKLSLEDYKILGGTTNILLPEETQQMRKVIRSYCHPDAEKKVTSWVFDVGLLVTDRPFNLVPRTLRTIPLPKEGIELSNNKTYCIAAGWGSAAHLGETVTMLQKVHLTLMTQSYCEKSIAETAKNEGSKTRFLSNMQICTMGTDGKDTCTGDSGGPLLCVIGKGRGKTLQLTGVCSWGMGCGERDSPGVWARLDVTKKWIRKILQDESAIRQSIIPISSHRSKSDQIRTESTSSVVVFTVISLWCINAINTFSL